MNAFNEAWYNKAQHFLNQMTGMQQANFDDMMRWLGFCTPSVLWVLRSALLCWQLSTNSLLISECAMGFKSFWFHVFMYGTGAVDCRKKRPTDSRMGNKESDSSIGCLVALLASTTIFTTNSHSIFQGAVSTFDSYL